MEQKAEANIKRVGLNVPRIRYWLSVGAQPSDTVGRLLGTSGMLPCHPRCGRDSHSNEPSGSPPASKTGSSLSADSPASPGPISKTEVASQGLREALFDSSPATGVGSLRII
jgi:Ribosomal protein S16